MFSLGGLLFMGICYLLGGWCGVVTGLVLVLAVLVFIHAVCGIAEVRADNRAQREKREGQEYKRRLGYDR